MRKIFCAVLLSSACAVVPTFAAAAEVQFVGRLIVTGKAGTCPNDPTGQRLTARWRPAGLGDNGNTTNFAFFRQTQAVGYRMTGAFDATLRPVESMVIAGGFGPLDFDTRISFSTVAPSPLSETAQTVNVTGRIRGFDFMPACVAVFSFAGVNRVGD